MESITNPGERPILLATEDQVEAAVAYAVETGAGWNTTGERVAAELGARRAIAHISGSYYPDAVENGGEDDMERWDRIEELRDAVVAALREIDGPGADIEVKWREVRLRREGHLVCCIPTPLLEGVDAEKIPGIVRSYLDAFDCGRSSMEPSVPFQIDREPVDSELEALRQKKIDEIEALDRAAASSRVSSEIPDAYRWDVGDPSRGPFGETGTRRD